MYTFTRYIGKKLCLFTEPFYAIQCSKVKIHVSLFLTSRGIDILPVSIYLGYKGSKSNFNFVILSKRGALYNKRKIQPSEQGSILWKYIFHK